MNSVSALLAAVNNGQANFKDVIDYIDDHYHYTAARYYNGEIDNAPGKNANSCKVFYFAKLNMLNAYDTLSLFAEHYASVLENPAGTDHPNIRQFKYHAWSGIIFYGEVLKPKTPEEVAVAVAKRLADKLEADRQAAEAAAKAAREAEEKALAEAAAARAEAEKQAAATVAATPAPAETPAS